MLAQAGVETPDLEARLILEKRGGFRWADILAGPERLVDAAVGDLIAADLQSRIGGMPLSRIYGERQFWGLDFEISPATLDPRPDTETLVEAVLESYGENPPPRILDLGTGSGCIIISLLHEWKNSEGIAADVSHEALLTARGNASRHNVINRLGFVRGNWADSLDMRFDLVVSNPPYIRESVIPALDAEVRNHDPILALTGGEDGLEAYKKIFSDLNRLLKNGGKAFFEIGFDQAESITRLVEESKLLLCRILPDIAGNPRVVEISNGDK